MLLSGVIEKFYVYGSGVRREQSDRRLSMKWNTFYYDFYEYSEKKMISCINQLEDMGSTDEIIDFINSSDYESARKALIEKALKNGVRFSSDDLGELECNFDDDFFKQIVASTLKNCHPLKPADIIEFEEWLDEKTVAKLALDCEVPFTEEELDYLDRFLDRKVMAKLYKKNGRQYDDPDDLITCDKKEDDEVKLEKMGLLDKIFIHNTINKLGKWLKP